MMDIQTLATAEELFSTISIEGKGKCIEAILRSSPTPNVSIPDVCLHKPRVCVGSISANGKNTGSSSKGILEFTDEASPSGFSSYSEVETCPTSEHLKVEENLSQVNEEKINLVSSQARLVRQNSLRLVTRFPRIQKRATAISELDRKWALGQCEELTTWVNSLLSTKEVSLKTDLKKSMSEGDTLPLLVSIISADFELNTTAAETEQDQVERTHSCIEHLKGLGYSSDVAASDIVHGDLKSIILFLGGLRNFLEQHCEVEGNLKPIAAMQGTASQDRNHTTAHGYDVRGTREATVSEKIKRILKEPQHSSSGVKDTINMQNRNSVREQPVGESDSAASPTSHYRDNPHGYYQTLENASHLQQTNHLSRHQTSPQQKQKPMQRTCVDQISQQHTESPPPQHRFYQDRMISCLSPHRASSTQSHASSQYNKSFSNPSSPDAANGPIKWNNSLSDSKAKFNDSEGTLAVTGTHRPAHSKADGPLPNGRHLDKNFITPSLLSKSPYTRRRQLPASPTYATIDEVKDYTVNASAQTVKGADHRVSSGEREQTVLQPGAASRSSPSRPNKEHSQSRIVDNQSRVEPSPEHKRSSSNIERLEPSSMQPEQTKPVNQAIGPDAQYETLNRRVSMPVVGYQTNTQYKPVVPRRRPTQKSASHTTPVIRDDGHEEDGYVDTSESDKESPFNNSDTHEGSGTPPLPALLLNEDMDEYMTSEPVYKSQRSLSASAKLLSTGVEQFQTRLRAAREQMSTQLVEKSDEHEEPEELTPSTTQNSSVSKEGTHEQEQQTAPSPQKSQHKNVGVANKQGQFQSAVNNRRRSSGSRPAESNKGHISQETGPQLDHKVDRLERMYEDISNYLHVSKSHRHSDTRRHSIASSSQYSYSHRHRRSRQSDVKSIQRRFHRLESHIVTLAKSVSHLSAEIDAQNSIFNEMDRISSELEIVKQHISPSAVSKPQDQLARQLDFMAATSQTETTPQKISKLRRFKSSIRKRFFGQEPPLMNIFLKQLGYEKYQPLFDAENIGMLELPYMSEERLRTIGIPLGPRVRILQEATRLSSSSTLPDMKKHSFVKS